MAETETVEPIKAPEPMNAFERHARAFCAELKDRLELIEDGQDSEGERVGDVQLTRVFAYCDIPPTYYPHIRELVFGGENPIAVMLSRGAGGRASVVHWRRDPVDEDFSGKTLTSQQEAARLAAQGENLPERVERLEALLRGLNVVEALRDHEERLAKLEESAG